MYYAIKLPMILIPCARVTGTYKHLHPFITEAECVIDVDSFCLGGAFCARTRRTRACDSSFLLPSLSIMTKDRPTTAVEKRAKSWSDPATAQEEATAVPGVEDEVQELRYELAEEVRGLKKAKHKKVCHRLY